MNPVTAKISATERAAEMCFRIFPHLKFTYFVPHDEKLPLIKFILKVRKSENSCFRSLRLFFSDTTASFFKKSRVGNSHDEIRLPFTKIENRCSRIRKKKSHTRLFFFFRINVLFLGTNVLATRELPIEHSLRNCSTQWWYKSSLGTLTLFYFTQQGRLPIVHSPPLLAQAFFVNHCFF